LKFFWIGLFAFIVKQTLEADRQSVAKTVFKASLFALLSQGLTDVV
jgi:hypothetical protein